MMVLGRALPIVAAFLLPLGAVGGIAGVTLAGLNLALFGRAKRPGDGLWLAVLLPLAVVPVVATVANPNGTPERVLFSIALGGPLLLGWPAARRLVACAGHYHAAVAFVFGASVLAASVIMDATIGWHVIPSGLFAESLHNTTAAVLVLAFPLALDLANRRQARVLGVVAASLLAFGVVAALSWVGALGLIAAALAYSTIRYRWGGLLTSGAIIAVGVATAYTLALCDGGSSLATLGEVLSSRARIFAQGLTLASKRPWLGWGVDHAGVGTLLQSNGLGVFYVDDLVLPHFHSLYAQTLATTGLVGFAALALALCVAFASVTGPWRHAVRAALIGHLATQGLDYAWNIASIVVSVGLVVALGTNRSGTYKGTSRGLHQGNEPTSLEESRGDGAFS